MRRSPSRLLRVPLVAALGLLAVVVPSLATQSVGATQTAAVLDPAFGQYVPIQNTTILDTRNGIGAAAGALPANGSVTVQATGVGQIPSTGVSAIFVNIQVLSSPASGFLTDYAADQPSPIGASVSFDAGFPTSGSDFLTIGGQQDSSQYGMVSFANHSGGTMQLAVQVEGYVTNGTQPSAGDTLFTLPWTDQVDTRSGLGVPNGDGTTGGPVAQLQPGQSVTVSDVGPNGVPYGGASASDIDAMEVTIGALNATNTGYLTVESQNANLTGDGGNQLRTLSYESGLKSRLTEIAQLTSNGTFQITNYGTNAVDVQVVVRGYFLLPTATSVAGSTYQPLSNNTQLCDTRSSCPYGGQQQYTLPAGGSINVQETGTAGIPASGVSGVAAEIDAVSPTATGWLTVNPYGSTPSFTEAFNFAPTHNSNVFDNSTVTQLGANGAITITNVSSGTVDVVVSARGYWLGATAPTAPTLDGSPVLNNGVASLSWYPSADGGAAITRYTLYSSSGSSSVVTNAATSGDVIAAVGDSVWMTATNAVGTSATSGSNVVESSSQLNTPFVPTFPLTIAGTVSPAFTSTGASSGLSVPSGLPVVISAGDVPIGSTTDYVEPIVGSTTTQSGGYWTFTIPSLASISSDIQSIALANGGFLDLDVTVSAIGQMYGSSAAESGEAFGSIYLGGGNLTSSPIQQTLIYNMTLESSSPSSSSIAASGDSSAFTSLMSSGKQSVSDGTISSPVQSTAPVSVSAPIQTTTTPGVDIVSHALSPNIGTGDSISNTQTFNPAIDTSGIDLAQAAIVAPDWSATAPSGGVGSRGPNTAAYVDSVNSNTAPVTLASWEKSCSQNFVGQFDASGGDNYTAAYDPSHAVLGTAVVPTPVDRLDAGVNDSVDLTQVQSTNFQVTVEAGFSVGVFGVSGSYMLDRGRGVISGGSADGPKDEIWRQNTVVNFEQGRVHCLGVDNSNGNDPFILDFSNLGALKKVCVDHGYDSNCDAWAQSWYDAKFITPHNFIVPQYWTQAGAQPSPTANVFTNNACTIPSSGTDRNIKYACDGTNALTAVLAGGNSTLQQRTGLYPGGKFGNEGGSSQTFTVTISEDLVGTASFSVGAVFATNKQLVATASLSTRGCQNRVLHWFWVTPSQGIIGGSNPQFSNWYSC